MPTTEPTRNHLAGRFRLVRWLFARKAVNEAVTTQVPINASPESIWNHIILYEEVPGRPPFLLRWLLPQPIRTEGDKTRVGATVRCTYQDGELLKRITRIEPPQILSFEVMEQHLGIEGCTLALGGSYEIRPGDNETDVLLTTNYQAYLRPRFLWRMLESLLVRQLHAHILDGVRKSIPPANRMVPAAVSESFTANGGASGSLACSVLKSRSHP